MATEFLCEPGLSACRTGWQFGRDRPVEPAQVCGKVETPGHVLVDVNGTTSITECEAGATMHGDVNRTFPGLRIVHELGLIGANFDAIARIPHLLACRARSVVGGIAV